VEEQLTDTFTVGSDVKLTLPVIGTVALRGILRAELQEQLTRAVGRVIRDPVIHAQPLLRFSVQGGVARPGYYSLPADAVLSDALMAAGGPAREARVAKLRIERDGEPLWEGDPLQRAIAAGRTLDDMNLRAGDQFVVPERRAVADAVRTIGIALTIPVTILTLISLF